MHIHYVWVKFQKISQSIASKNGLHGYVYNFSVDCHSIDDVDDILDIHKYLMKKHGMKYCLDLNYQAFAQQKVLMDH